MENLHLTIYASCGESRKVLFQGKFSLAIMEKIGKKFLNIMTGEEIATARNFPIVVNAAYKEIVSNKDLEQWGNIAEFKEQLGKLLLACFELEDDDKVSIPTSRVYTYK